MSELTVKLPDGKEVDGTAPLVLIGPNGSGKSRMANALADTLKYQLVPATRLTAIHFVVHGGSMALISKERAVRLSLPEILTEFLKEEQQEASRFTQNRRRNPDNADAPPVTRLSQFTDLFEMLFPGRKLDLSSRDMPSVSWVAEPRQSKDYHADQMSDGEKAGLDLIARLLRANPGIIIIDEPEVHLHPLLAREFWTRIERFRPDCRFVYLTHDLPFALSRIGARIGIVKNDQKVDLLPEFSSIPDDLVESLLGAATVSILAKRVVFCEGKSAGSIDFSFYSAWFRSEDCVVAPLGGCEQVQRAVSALKHSPILSNVTVLGIIDRDYWPDRHLDRLKQEGLIVLPFHEVESLLCIREVAAAIASHTAVTSFDARYDAFLESTRKSFKGFELSKLILERTKREFELAILGMTNGAKPSDDLRTTRTNFMTAACIDRAVPDIGRLFDGQANNVETALKGKEADLLRVIPGKHCLSLLAQKLDLYQQRYIELIQQALLEVKGGPLDDLQNRLVQALKPHLPPR